MDPDWEGMPREKRERSGEGRLHRLEDIEDRVNHIPIPLAYAEELYRLRSHINFVRERVRGTIDRHGVAVGLPK